MVFFWEIKLSLVFLFSVSCFLTFHLFSEHSRRVDWFLKPSGSPAFQQRILLSNAYFYGRIFLSDDFISYLAILQKLFDYFLSDSLPSSALLINTCGWIEGITIDSDFSNYVQIWLFWLDFVILAVMWGYDYKSKNIGSKCKYYKAVLGRGASLLDEMMKLFDPDFVFTFTAPSGFNYMATNIPVKIIIMRLHERLLCFIESFHE